jgi:choloylglycine hydrolase
MKSSLLHQLICVILTVSFAMTPPTASWACTRILWNNNQLAIVVGRTMDWPESTLPILTILPPFFSF